MEEAWTVNHAVGGSSPSWVRLTKSLHQAFNPKIAGTFELRPKPKYYRGQVEDLPLPYTYGLPGVFSPDALHNASLWITLTVSEVVDTEN